MMGKILVLAAACMVALGGCDSQEHADKEAYKPSAYGSNETIYKPQERSK